MWRPTTIVMILVVMLMALNLQVAAVEPWWKRQTASTSSQSRSSTPSTSSQSSSNTASSTPSATKSYSISTPVEITQVVVSAATSTRKPANGEIVYYKVGTDITFSWNISQTNTQRLHLQAVAQVQAQPSGVPFDIATNVSITDQNVTWITGNVSNPALMSASYRLYIWDADRSRDSSPQNGYISTYANLVFKMYVPQPYSNLSDNVCATCSAASLPIYGSLMTISITMITVFVFLFTAPLR